MRLGRNVPAEELNRPTSARADTSQIRGAADLRRKWAPLSFYSERHDRGASATIERSGDCRTDGVGGATDRVGVEMSIALCSSSLCVAEELADDRQA